VQLKSTNSPLVSVIVPSFNHGRYITEALNSVLNQTYPNIELIVVDDKSTDSSLKLVNKWIASIESKNRFSRVHLSCNSKNSGAAYSLNEGLKIARGELITFLNSDDYYDKTRIERLAGAYSGEDHFCAFGPIECVYETGTNVDIDLISIVESIPDRIADCLSSYVPLIRENIAVTSGNIFISRSLAKTLNGFQNLLYCHDWEFLVRAGKYCEIKFIENAWYYYRLHDKNSFRDLSNQAGIETEAVFKSMNDPVRQTAAHVDLIQCDLVRHGII
jgi:glycosyltransferase involved in cell wall biosynthesis